MKIINPASVTKIPVLSAVGVPDPVITRQDIVSPADGATRFEMRIFEIEPGCEKPFHPHPVDHGLFVIGGQGECEYGPAPGIKTPFGEGWVVFTPNEDHIIRNTHSTKTLKMLNLVSI